MNKIDKLVAIILAAGKGTRMNSSLPKVLHKVANRPMIIEVVDLVHSLDIERIIVVIGHQGELVKYHLNEVETVEQKKRLGTAHAVAQTQILLKDFRGDVLVLYGDIPLLTTPTLKRLLERHRQEKASCTFLTTILDNPFGYGRVTRDSSGNVKGIVEERSASPSERAIKEINVGAYCFESQDLFETLKKVKLNKEKGEYYLTDAISILIAQGSKVEAVLTENHREAIGVNTEADLTRAKEIAKNSKNNHR